MYVIRCVSGTLRDNLIEEFKAVGIPSRPYFTPIHLQPFYRDTFGWQPGDFPHTEQAGQTFLALPFSSVMTEAQVEYVCEHLKKICGNLLTQLTQ